MISSSVSYASPSKVGGTGTTEKVFPSLLSALVPASLAIPQSANGQILTVKAAGTLFVHGTTPTVNVVLQSGSSLTGASNTTVSTGTSAQALATGANYPWAFEADIQGDQASGVVQVVNAKLVVNGTSVSLTNTSLTGIAYNGTGAAYNLVIGVTFGVSDALNTAALQQFGAAFASA